MKYKPFKDIEIQNIRKMQSSILKSSYKALKKDFPLELFSEILEYVNRDMELPISARNLEIVLSMDGYAYYNMLEFGLEDTEARGSLHNAIAKHYMHRPWPMSLEKDFPGVNEFEEILKQEIKKSEKAK